MATIRVFEDLECWQLARRLCLLIHKFISEERFSKSYSLKNQIDASSGSVMDNIAEGFERSGRKEFIQFLAIAKGSAGETRSQLYRANDKGLINQVEFEQAFDLTIKVASTIQGMINYLNKTEYKGAKYKVEEDPEVYQTEYPETFFIKHKDA
jgi:four helix bundle protein